MVISFVTSYILCGTEQNYSGIDTIKLEEYTAVFGNRISLDSIAGTYNGVLPPNVETTLTLKLLFHLYYLPIYNHPKYLEIHLLYHLISHKIKCFLIYLLFF